MRLAEQQQAAGTRRAAIDPDQRFGADRRAGLPEQRMTARDIADRDRAEAAHRAPENRRIDRDDSTAGREARAFAVGQRQCCLIDAESIGPTADDDRDHRVEIRRFHRLEDGPVYGRDRAAMAAGEGDQILVRLFGGTEPGAQGRERANFNGMEASHGSGV